jgi:hypothetical protein
LRGLPGGGDSRGAAPVTDAAIEAAMRCLVFWPTDDAPQPVSTSRGGVILGCVSRPDLNVEFGPDGIAAPPEPAPNGWLWDGFVYRRGHLVISGAANIGDGTHWAWHNLDAKVGSFASTLPAAALAAEASAVVMTFTSDPA